MLILNKKLFNNGCYVSEKFMALLNRGNHKEVMRYLKNTGYNLNKNDTAALITRGNHKEIMLMLNRKLFDNGCYVSDRFMVLLNRGNHKEIMCYLKNTKYNLNKSDVEALIARGNHKEIMLMLNRKLFKQTNTEVNNQESDVNKQKSDFNRSDYECNPRSVFYGCKHSDIAQISIMDMPYDPYTRIPSADDAI